tara:strand:- start:280 stop:435 length:156 start_codon:yes stop_codon:yes gene_type:complete
MMDKLTKSYDKKSNKEIAIMWLLREKLNKKEQGVLSKIVRQRQIRQGGLEL